MRSSAVGAFLQRRANAVRPPTPNASKFPVTVHSSNRYLVDAAGTPFPFYGDYPSSALVQLTNAQIDTYLDARQQQGITVLYLEAIEHKFSGQSPAYKNVDGVAPFTVMSPVNWVMNDAYWQRLDYLVNGAKACGMLVLINPCYLGFGGGDEGWTTEITAATAGALQQYGTDFANRYTQGNVGLVMLGDYSGTVTERNKQWNFVTGWRAVRTTDLISGHTNRTEGEAYPSLTGYAGFNFNNIYVLKDGTNAHLKAADAYARNMLFFLLEDGFEGEATLAQFRRSKYQSMLGGACGILEGNNPIWGFGEPVSNGGAGAAAALASDLHSVGSQQMTYLRALFNTYAWHLLVPKTSVPDLVTSPALSAGATRICPALASDGSFAMIFSPGVDVTVDMTKITHAGVRARLFDPTTGTFTAVGTFANTGTRAFTISSESVLVLD